MPPLYVKHCLNFSFVFSAPLPALRNLFSAMGIFCSGRYQPGLYWDLLISGRLPGQRITISKM
jgi:hypothetical protein